jgi:hypothetical protein
MVPTIKARIINSLLEIECIYCGYRYTGIEMPGKRSAKKSTRDIVTYFNLNADDECKNETERALINMPKVSGDKLNEAIWSLEFMTNDRRHMTIHGKSDEEYFEKDKSELRHFAAFLDGLTRKYKGPHWNTRCHCYRIEECNASGTFLYLLFVEKGSDEDAHNPKAKY